MSESPFLAGNFAPVQDEIAVHDLPVSGRLPDALRGTLFRNGPNPHFEPVEPYHWFSGDGMVHAISLHGGRASYRNRWVRTPRFRAEADAGQPLFAGFATPLTEAARTLDNGVANTHVLPHAGRLLALEEAHPPTRLEPGDLSTLGYDDFGGGVSGAFTAHPKRDPRTGELVFFSYSATGPLSRGMTWGTITADGRVSRCESFDAPYCSMVHDFAVTSTHVVFPVLPLTGDLERAMAGGPPLAWDPGRGGYLGILNRERGVASLVWNEFESRFTYHGMNAFDTDGGVAMDVVEYDAAPLFPNADGSAPSADSSRSRLSRWLVDPSGRAPVRREVLDELPGEFPRIDDRRAGLAYAHGYRVSRTPDGGQAIVRHDLGQGRRSLFVLQDGESPSEVVFVPDTEDAPEGEGWLLSVVWRPMTGDSALVVLNAQAIEQGPVAVVPLPRRVPFGFHGSWVPAADEWLR